MIDPKYDLRRHPNIRQTPDGGAKPFSHTEPLITSATIEATEGISITAEEIVITPDVSYEILSDEEIEELIFMKGH